MTATHWTDKSIKDFLFSIAFDFVSQLENKMKAEGLIQDEYASILGVSKGRVSQIFNNPGNITLYKMIQYARALGLKVSIVVYDDNDPGNKKGTINSEIFKNCWEIYGKPRDFWAFQEKTEKFVSNISASEGSTIPSQLEIIMEDLKVYSLFLNLFSTTIEDKTGVSQVGFGMQIQ